MGQGGPGEIIVAGWWCWSRVQPVEGGGEDLGVDVVEAGAELVVVAVAGQDLAQRCG
ncbi:MAG: hypothetical protein ACRDQX_03865 [Pseudonocardiaceae bacterium]